MGGAGGGKPQKPPTCHSPPICHSRESGNPAPSLASAPPPASPSNPRPPLDSRFRGNDKRRPRWCPWPGLNWRPLPYQGSALPLSHMGGARKAQARPSPLLPRRKPKPATERVKGIEPSYQAWKARALPLSYTRQDARRRRALRPRSFACRLFCAAAVAFPFSRLAEKPRQPSLVRPPVEGAGFEPAKAQPPDLQSGPFDRSGTPPAIWTIFRISRLF